MWKQLIITIIVCATMGYCASTTVSLEHNWGYELTKLLLKREVSWLQCCNSWMITFIAIPLFVTGLNFGYARIHSKAPVWWRLFAAAPLMLQLISYKLTSFFSWSYRQNRAPNDSAPELATVLQLCKDSTVVFLSDPIPPLVAIAMVLIPLYGALAIGECLYKNLSLRTVPLKIIMPATQALILLTLLSFIYDRHLHWLLSMSLDFTAIAAVAALATYNCRMTEYSRALSASFFATLPFTSFNLFNLAYQLCTDSDSAIVSASLITCAAAAATLIGAKVGTIIVSAK